MTHLQYIILFYFIFYYNANKRQLLQIIYRRFVIASKVIHLSDKSKKKLNI